MDISDFRGQSPVMLPEEFLAGRLDGWGILEGPLGGLKARYTISANGIAVPNGVDFTETWRFDYGLTETLSWRIRRIGPGQYSGTEPKVEGDAAGEQAGFAFHWTYSRQTPQQNGDPVVLNFDDWFYLIDERTCIVRGSAGRLGLPFAIAHATYRKI